MAMKLDDSCALFAHETLDTPNLHGGAAAAAPLALFASGAGGCGRASAPSSIVSSAAPSWHEDTLDGLCADAYRSLKRKADAAALVSDGGGGGGASPAAEDGAVNAAAAAKPPAELSRWVREEVVSWLVDTGHSIALGRDTIAMAVKVFDRYVLLSAVAVAEVSDVAAAALLIASKMHDGCPPPLAYLSSYTDSVKEDILKMESKILQALRWQVNFVTASEAAPFVYRRLRELGVRASEELIEMLLDITLLDWKLSRRNVCTAAAACVILATELESTAAMGAATLRQCADVLEQPLNELAATKQTLREALEVFFLRE